MVLFFILQLVSHALLVLLSSWRPLRCPEHAVCLVCFHPAHQPTLTARWRVLSKVLAMPLGLMLSLPHRSGQTEGSFRTLQSLECT